MQVIGIAGGSGSGKSTVSYALSDSDPAIFEVLNLDDYQRLKDEPNLPMLAGMINWDHPDIIRWDALIADIEKLQRGEPIVIDSWAHRSNPDYVKHGRMIRRTIKPKPVLIVEGYLALYNPLLNHLYDKTFYLDLDTKTRAARRDKSALDRTIDELRSNPAVVHKLDIPVICDPYFPYATKWRKDSPCPINSLPSPAQIIERNGKVYGKHQLALNFKHIAWLPDKLKKAAIKNFRGATSDMLTKKRAQFRSRHSV